jgi:hypothetical protein
MLPIPPPRKGQRPHDRVRSAAELDTSLNMSSSLAASVAGALPPAAGGGAGFEVSTTGATSASGPTLAQLREDDATYPPLPPDPAEYAEDRRRRRVVGEARGRRKRKILTVVALLPLLFVVGLVALSYYSFALVVHVRPTDNAKQARAHLLNCMSHLLSFAVFFGTMGSLLAALIVFAPVAADRGTIVTYSNWALGIFFAVMFLGAVYGIYRAHSDRQFLTIDLPAVRVRFNLDNLVAVLSLVAELFSMIAFVFQPQIPWTTDSNAVPFFRNFVFDFGVDTFLLGFWTMAAVVTIFFVMVIVIVGLHNFVGMSLELLGSSWVVNIGFPFFGETLFIPVATVLMSALNCTRVEGSSPERMTLNASSDIECWTGVHRIYSALSLLALMSYTPTALFYFTRLNALSDGAFVGSKLDIKFTPVFYMWATLLRSVLAGVSTFLSGNRPLMIAGNLVGALALIALNLWYQPCCIGVINRIRTLSYATAAWASVSAFFALVVDDGKSWASFIFWSTGTGVLLASMLVVLLTHDRGLSRTEAYALGAGRRGELGLGSERDLVMPARNAHLSALTVRKIISSYGMNFAIVDAAEHEKLSSQQRKRLQQQRGKRAGWDDDDNNNNNNNNNNNDPKSRGKKDINKGKKSKKGRNNHKNKRSVQDENDSAFYGDASNGGYNNNGYDEEATGHRPGATALGGDVLVWGMGDLLTVEPPPRLDSILVPTRSPALSRKSVVDIVVGLRVAFAITESGAVYMWTGKGRNEMIKEAALRLVSGGAASSPPAAGRRRSSVAPPPLAQASANRGGGGGGGGGGNDGGGGISAIPPPRASPGQGGGGSPGAPPRVATATRSLASLGTDGLTAPGANAADAGVAETCRLEELERIEDIVTSYGVTRDAYQRALMAIPSHEEPTPLTGDIGGERVTAVVVSPINSVFFTTYSGRVYAMGNNINGILGLSSTSASMAEIGSAAPRIEVPEVVDALEHLCVVAIRATATVVFALTDDGQLYTWGCGRFGLLGHGDTRDHAAPQLVATLAELGEVIVEAIPLSEYAIARTEDGRVYTWGSYGPITPVNTDRRAALRARQQQQQQQQQQQNHPGQDGPRRQAFVNDDDEFAQGDDDEFAGDGGDNDDGDNDIDDDDGVPYVSDLGYDDDEQQQATPDLDDYFDDDEEGEADRAAYSAATATTAAEALEAVDEHDGHHAGGHQGHGGGDTAGAAATTTTTPARNQPQQQPQQHRRRRRRHRRAGGGTGGGGDIIDAPWPTLVASLGGIRVVRLAAEAARCPVVIDERGVLYRLVYKGVAEGVDPRAGAAAYLDAAHSVDGARLHFGTVPHLVARRLLGGARATAVDGNAALLVAATADPAQPGRRAEVHVLHYRTPKTDYTNIVEYAPPIRSDRPYSLNLGSVTALAAGRSHVNLLARK